MVFVQVAQPALFEQLDLSVQLVQEVQSVHLVQLWQSVQSVLLVPLVQSLQFLSSVPILQSLQLVHLVQVVQLVQSLQSVQFLQLTQLTQLTFPSASAARVSTQITGIKQNRAQIITTNSLLVVLIMLIIFPVMNINMRSKIIELNTIKHKQTYSIGEYIAY